MSEKCDWCGTDPEEAAKRHEAPHATWCLHHRSWREPAPMGGLVEAQVERDDECNIKSVTLPGTGYS